MRKLIGLIIFLNSWMAFSQPARLSGLNLDHFTVRQKNLSSEFSNLVPAGFLNHPDLGIMPFDGPPCSDCIELIDRRDAFSRYFVKENTNGSHFVQQKAASPINYQDINGNWREINYRLKKVYNKFFISSFEPLKVIIDLNENNISLFNGNLNIVLKSPELFWKGDDGIEHSFGISNMSDISAGDDGIIIRNIYPGIDLVYSVQLGEIETSFILNQRLPYTSGEICLREPLILPQECSFSKRKSEGAEHNEIFINDDNQNSFFEIKRGYAFGNNLFSEPLRIKSKIGKNNALEFSVPVSWLSDPATTYPVIIDPVVKTQNSLPLAAIAGTKFSPVCWTNSCDYFLNVNTPANATITNIYHSFQFFATGPCFAEDGGYSIDFLGCHSPTDPVNYPNGVYTSPLHISNFTFNADTVLLPEFNVCFPPPQCAPLGLNFTLHFFRCNNDPDTNCAANCILATKPWTMFIEGRTLELSYITASQQICEGNSAQVVAAAQYGVPPYGFLWSPVASANDTLTDSPVTTTNYSVTVTDACGITASGTSTVNVTADNNPGFTISPNPVCVNVPVTFSGNGAGAVNDYDWIVSGSNAPGGIVNDDQTPSVSYTLPGNFDVIMTYPNGACLFNDTLQLSVTPLAVISVALTAQPAGAICQGDVVTFKATPVNGGAAPVYDWLVDGVNVQSGNSDSLVTGALNNGSLVQVILHANSFCSAPLIDTASLFMAISNALTPQVIISPDTAVCTGSSITLNATPTNGGVAPTYQWFTNGVPVAGATSSSFTFNVTPPDTIISVQITSSLSCVVMPTANDSSTVNILQNIQPLVTLTANPPGMICSGDSIQYSAHSVYGGGAPQFSWYVNGVLSVVTDSVFTIFPVNNDSVSVNLTSSLTCVVSNNANDYQIAIVTQSVSPTVSMAAAPSTIICMADTIIFTASATNAGTPTYSWSINGNPVGINDSIFSSSTLNDNDIVSVVINSSLSCAPSSSDTDSIIVSVSGNVAPSVIVSESGNTICEGDPVQFYAVPNNGGATPAFQWFVNGVSTGLSSDTIVLASLNNNDTVQAFMTSSLGCVTPPVAASAPFIKSLLPRVTPQVNISVIPSDTICIGQEVTLQATILNGGNAPAIQWYVNSIQISETSNVLTSSTFGQGDVIVSNIVSNANCLTQTGDTSNFVRIVYHPPLNVQLAASNIDCPGSPVTIVANVSGGNGGPYHLLWSNGFVDTNSIIINPGRNTKVLIQAEDNCTVQPATFTYTVPVLTAPVADFSYANPSPGSFLNNIQFINLSSDADSWSWYFPDDNSSTTILNPLHQFPKQGTYDVILITQNNSGCIDSISYRVTVQEEISVFYPNSFTPNGDGINDFFQPLGASLEEYEMTIWNRWGEMIYEGNSKMAWNGIIRNSSSPAPEGVYVFRIDLMDDKFEKRVVTGRITLIR